MVNSVRAPIVCDEVLMPVLVTHELCERIHVAVLALSKGHVPAYSCTPCSCLAPQDTTFGTNIYDLPLMFITGINAENK